VAINPAADLGVIIMKILHLILKRKWFDLIASGKKTVEYREYKPYWEKRLVGKEFQEIHFRNGYSKDAPFMRVQCLGIVNVPDTGGPLFKPKQGEDLKGWQFAILLGAVLAVKYNNPIHPAARTAADRDDRCLMHKEIIMKLQNLFESIICLAVEGPEFFTKLELMDAIQKEAMQGHELCKRHLSSKSSGRDEAELNEGICPMCHGPVPGKCGGFIPHG